MEEQTTSGKGDTIFMEHFPVASIRREGGKLALQFPKSMMKAFQIQTVHKKLTA